MQTKIHLYSSTSFVGAILILIGLLIGCATPQAPEGGPQDTQYPQINPKRYSTPNPSTNFQDNQIILTFDEWIKLQAAYNQVIISPPLENNPSIKIRNKSVVVKWKEALKDSTTYIINFGDAVQDITEGNIAPNLKMVFSTGPYLDSLTCSGQIVDAATRKPKEEVLVMLYRNLADSIPRSQKPYYFTKTNKQGAFRLEYLKAGTYRIFALEDKNRDYKYNLNNESIAFLDSSFQINDTTKPVLRLRMFQEREHLKVVNTKLDAYGALKLEFNNKIHSPNTIEFLEAPDDFKMLTEAGEDTMKIWFDGTLDSVGKWKFVIKNELEQLNDTIRVSAKSRDYYERTADHLRWYKKRAVTNEGAAAKTARGTEENKFPLRDTVPIQQHPFEAIALDFTRPIQTWDSTKFVLFKDSAMSTTQSIITEQMDSTTGLIVSDTVHKDIVIDTFIRINAPTFVLNEKLQLFYDWEPNARYQLMLLPNGVTDFFNFSNVDTLTRIYTINKKENYGTVTAIIKGGDSTKQYVVQLIDSKENVLEETIIQDSTQMTILYENIKTDTYTIRVIHDEVPNGWWDVGNYDEGRQAEQTTSSKPIGLNPGWENMMELNLKPTGIRTKAEKGGKERNTPKEDTD
ncbi:Ig-like domain-containing protein [Aureispira anguillae]|uniref:Ig-like domain-containing protein n=1 Tax=Aureispira anguillae TaxID=2864201 RepID=A0A915YJQ2_9BACT|nr:Ig-like domain-containing protein [Aureispira anguillae]BDS14242.1 Ig-like domain-containing protein [Aureispira anguillae]